MYVYESPLAPSTYICPYVASDEPLPSSLLGFLLMFVFLQVSQVWYMVLCGYQCSAVKCVYHADANPSH